MNNKDILNVLTEQFNQRKSQLQNTRLTDEFDTLVRNLKDNPIFGNPPNQEFIETLENYSQNKSLNDIISSYISKIDSIETVVVKSDFKASIDSFKKMILKHENCQTILVEYDSFDDKEAFCHGFPSQKIDVINSPRYLNEEVDWDEIIFEGEEFVNFENSWFDIEELEFTTIGLNVYYDMQKLIQLKSILILHGAFQEMENEGAFKDISRKIDLLINEHDCKSSFLYTIN